MLNENAEPFWERVKKLIKENSTTQEWLASQCDVSLGMVKSWIFNKRLPDAAQAARIASALDTSVEYLVTGEDTTPVAEENIKLKEKIQKAIETLSE
jgi:transcriptional regulator with XRE-family HTH domain